KVRRRKHYHRPDSFRVAPAIIGNASADISRLTTWIESSVFDEKPRGKPPAFAPDAASLWKSSGHSVRSPAFSRGEHDAPKPPRPNMAPTAIEIRGSSSSRQSE